MPPPLGLQALAVCIVGKTLGAVGCFLISQQAKPLVERLMRRHRRLRALERTVHAHPLKATLLVRFSMLPAPIKNYGWGSLGVDFRIFLVATLLEVRRLHTLGFTRRWRGARASHSNHRVWQAPMYALPPVLLGGQLNDLADLAAGRQRIRLHPLQLGLGVLMLVLLVLLATTSHRWLEAEQRGAASDLPCGTDDTETEPVLTPCTRKDYGSPGPPRGV